MLKRIPTITIGRNGIYLHHRLLLMIIDTKTNVVCRKIINEGNDYIAYRCMGVYMVQLLKPVLTLSCIPMLTNLNFDIKWFDIPIIIDTLVVNEIYNVVNWMD